MKTNAMAPTTPSHCFPNLSPSYPEPPLPPSIPHPPKKVASSLDSLCRENWINRWTVRAGMLSLCNGMHRADIVSEIVSGRKPLLSVAFSPLSQEKYEMDDSAELPQTCLPLPCSSLWSPTSWHVVILFSWNILGGKKGLALLFQTGLFEELKVFSV